MTRDAQTCRPDTDLAAVAALMWDHDCGFVPVVDPAGALAGVITDRDICMAVTTRRLLPERIAAAQVMNSPVRCCMASDTLTGALEIMKRFKVRRLPVIDPGGTLVGILALNDIVLAAGKPRSIGVKELVSALSAISAHRSIQPADA